MQELAEHVIAGRLRLSHIIDVARLFGVSTTALLWRLVNLGVISREAPNEILRDTTFRDADRATMSGHWWTPRDLPKRFVERAFVAHKLGRLSRARLAKLLEQDIASLPGFLALYGLDIELLDVAYEAQVSLA